MRWKIGFVVVAAAFLLVTAIVSAQTKGGGFSGAPAQQANWYADSVAFVVGINSYSHGWGRLSAGVSDAKKMAKTLRARGFTVHELYDTKAKGPEIIKQLRKAAQLVGKDDRFVFYYSGHGHTQRSAFDDSEIGYLVPIEGRSGDTTSYIPMDQLRTEIMNNCAAKHVLVVVDSCFSGTLLTRSTIADSSISDYLSKKGIYGITAGMQDQPAVDGLFTNVLVEGMNGNADYNGDGYVTFKELGMYAENNVKAKNRHQTPDYGVMYGAGQFVFARKGEAVAGVVAVPKPKYKAPTTDYGAIAKAQEEANSKARRNAAGKAYASLKRQVREKTSLSSSSKKASYQQYLNDYPTDNPYYDEVDGWYNEQEEAAVVEGDMVKIPAGWFYMGCSPGDSECADREKPRKRVYLDSFYMDVHETTVAEYRQCVSAGSCTPPKGLPSTNNSTIEKWRSYHNWDKSGRDDHPINNVSWNDANSYCQWKGKRLPTEAEFERALRGGVEGRKYPWGNSSTPPSQYGNYADESAKRQWTDWSIIKSYDDGYVGTAPVCRFSPNGYGLCDISGNVLEWCMDWHDTDYYNRMSEKNPINRTKASTRVLRGGCWLPSPRDLRSSSRSDFVPTTWVSFIGFRCSQD